MNKKFITILLCIALHSLSFVGLYAKKAYLDMEWVECKKNKAVFLYETSEATLVNGKYSIPIYYTDGTLYCEGNFSSKEVSFNTRNGQFTYYFRTGKTMCEGSFEAGTKTGHWKIYYVQGGIEREGDYNNGNRVGNWIYYNTDRTVYDTVEIVPDNFTGNKITTHNNGQVDENKNYVNGVLHGSYERYYKNGHQYTNGEYDSGRRINGWNFYYNSGQIASRVVFGANERLDSVYFFNEDGSVYNDYIDTATLWRHPEMDEKIRQSIIGKHLLYPSLAIENGIQGQVKVQFRVMPDGSIDNVKCINDIKLDFGMEEECMRIVKDFFIFSPHKIYNMPSPIIYAMPIKFRLQ